MKKRFIAGAICPKCQALDRIIMLTDSLGEEHIECIACDYRDMRPQHISSPALNKVDEIGVIQFRPRR
ncbi:YheV family putative zinc ribbon protein [Acinetobacter rathckeae]|uniref:YheV family putative zinc ribbon protein n=1 Tax=Acinetobacter rathckeae TaxID=2605272 RepID=UPI0018A2976B|nr:YheV family putative zinc ribbon protein [Acinetobacter rathckeae]MBF7688509.1 YheV family putative metal-binding protein [Acinetobacter rathckeae]MBF7695593.1 YheV family putative metal-binding protein [Acinetobacter rathckeae]